MSVYDCIVVGAGIIGSCTAYHLAKEGKKTLLLEQFFLPHSRGSSCGQSRIIRKAYNKAYYNQMLDYSYQMWDELEKETGETLQVTTGMLVIGKPDHEKLNEMRSSLQQHDLPRDEFSPRELKQRFKSLKYGEDERAFLDNSAGILIADKCVRVIQDLVRKHGCEIKEGTKMLEITPGEQVTTVQTNKGDFYTKSVVICAGTWADKILRNLGVQLPIVPTRATVMYWKCKDTELTVEKNFPTVYHCQEDRKMGFFYMFPSFEYPGMCKASFHLESKEYCDPDSRNLAFDEDFKNMVSDYVRKHLPALVPHPYIVEYCMYSESPDLDYVLDRHPKYHNILIATGFSGHGFKLAPAVGKVMADMAIGKEPSFDSSPFTISRFTNKMTAKL